MSEIVIISGPTCSGKTAKAIEIAEKLDAEIISCDSVQVYRGMDIGSAKASPEELARIPHHLIDVAEVSENFDVAKYIELSKLALADITRRGKKAVVVGGSGFYLKAWFAPVTDSLHVPAEIKKLSAAIETRGGAKALAEALLKIDPHADESIDMQNPRRTKNALERCMSSGKSVSTLLREFSELPCPMGELNREVVFLDRADNELFELIKRRTDAMISNGLVEETRKLLEAGIKANPSASAAIGYRETIRWIEEGLSDTGHLSDAICANTRALVKKQRKFLKGLKALCPSA